jgi:Rrf2 family protein
MKLSTRARYGTRALLDIALYWGGEPVLMKDIARRQHISLPYLQHLISPLVDGGIIKSTRGVGGGVWLARSPDKIKLSEVVRLLEGSVSPVECINKPEICNQAGSCAARDVWSELNRAIEGVLESMTLQDLVDRQRTKRKPDEIIYQI